MENNFSLFDNSTTVQRNVKFDFKWPTGWKEMDSFLEQPVLLRDLLLTDCIENDWPIDIWLETMKS